MFPRRKPLPFALSAVALIALSSPAVPGTTGMPGEPGEKSKAAYKAKAGYGAEAELTAADATEVKRLFGLVVSSGESECCKAAEKAQVVASEKAECPAAACNHEATWEKLSEMLAWKPAAWDVVKPMALARFDGGSNKERSNVLSLLAWQYSEPAVAIASEIAETHPATEFTEDQLLAFAEAGSKRFWKRVVALQAESSSALPAAMVALHGGEAAVGTLKEAVARPFDPDQATETYAAALALSKLGHPEHLEATRAALQTAALRALDEGDLARATELALTTEFLHESCSPYKAARLSFLDARRAWHCRARAEKVRSAEDVFALVEHLSAL